MIVLIPLGLLILYFVSKSMVRKKNASLMVAKPYVREMDSRRSRSGWKGGF